MATFYVSLMITRPPSFDDEGLKTLLREAIDSSACIALDVSTTRLLVEADIGTIEVLEMELRTQLEDVGSELNNFTPVPS